MGPLVISMAEWEPACLLGFCEDGFLASGIGDNTKRPNVVLPKKSTRPGRKPSCGTGGGPHGQSQVFNLVNGVVTRRLAAADATSVKDGACGTKLLERVQ